MKKQLIMTMCGAMIFTSVFGGSFADTTKAKSITAGTTIKATELEGAYSDDLDLDFDYDFDYDFEVDYQAPKWDDYKDMLKKGTTKTTETQLKALFDAANALEQKDMKDWENMTDAEYKKIDDAWEKFWTEADKNIDISSFELTEASCNLQDFDDDMDFPEANWDDYKGMLKKGTPKTTETQLKALFDAANTLEQKSVKEEKDVTEADYKKIDSAWDKFWVEAEKNLDESQFEMIEAEILTWNDYKGYLGTELTKANEAVLEKLFNEASAAEKKLFDGKKEITENDYEALNKIWDKYYTEEDKHIKVLDSSTK